MIQEPKVCIRRSHTPARRVLPPDAFCFCGVLPRGKHSESERKMCHGDYAKKQQPLRDRTPFQAIAPLFHSHNADPDGQLPLQHRGSDLCGTGRGDHWHGGGQRGLSGVHSGQRGLAAAGPADPLRDRPSRCCWGTAAPPTSACVWGARSRKRQTASSVMPLPGSSPAALFWHWSMAFSRRRS